MKQERSQFIRWFRIVGAPALSLLLYFTDTINAPAMLMGSRVVEMIVIAIASYTFSEITLRISYWLDDILPWELNATRRFGAQFGALVVSTVIFVLTVQSSLEYLTLGRVPMEHVRQSVTLGLIWSLLVTGFFTGDFFFNRWKQSLLDGLRYQQAATEAQLAAIKSQIDPHFLFNSLSILTTIIEEDPPLAVSFVEQLSHTYRYVLQHRDQQWVTLEEELAFIKAYLFLCNIRFGENLRVDCQVTPNLHQTKIAPATLQLLVENAIKHNVVSRERPLFIHLRVEEGKWIVVQNNVQRICPPPVSSRVGLANLTRRYALLTHREPIVVETADTFTVKIPLTLP